LTKHWVVVIDTASGKAKERHTYHWDGHGKFRLFFDPLQKERSVGIWWVMGFENNVHPSLGRGASQQRKGIASRLYRQYLHSRQGIKQRNYFKKLVKDLVYVLSEQV